MISQPNNESPKHLVTRRLITYHLIAWSLVTLSPDHLID
jgi:hypothetical protein